MLPQIALHLSDEALLRLRDGESVEARAREHLEHCPLCQELLRAWRDFAEAIQAARQEEPGIAPVASISPIELLTRESSLAYSRTVARLQEEVPPELPDAWLKRLLPGFRKRPAARGELQVRSLFQEPRELAGTAWFHLPPGQPAELFVHRSRPPFRLRIEPDGDEV